MEPIDPPKKPKRKIYLLHSANNVRINSRIEESSSRVPCKDGVYGVLRVTKDEANIVEISWKKNQNGNEKRNSDYDIFFGRSAPMKDLTDSFIDISTGETVNAADKKEKKEAISTQSRVDAKIQSNSLKVVLAVTDILRVRYHNPRIGVPYLIFYTHTGVAHTPLFFMRGGTKTFLNAVRKHIPLIKSPTDRTLYILGVSTGPSFAPIKYLSKAKNSFLSVFDTPKPTSRPEILQRQADLALSMVIDPELTRDPHEIAKDHSQVHSGLGSFELMDADGDGDNTEGILDLPILKRKNSNASPPPPPLSLDEWAGFFDSEGRLNCQKEVVQKRVFRSGIDSAVRKELWEYFSNLYPWDSTNEERKALRKTQQKDYERLKIQWQSVSEEQASHWKKFTVNKERIEKDVIRTDREHPKFTDVKGPYVEMLHDLLLSYVFFNFDTGYVQGMGDLLTPFLVVIDDEPSAFWCYKKLMDRKVSNFNKDQTGINTQLDQTRALLAMLDPALYKHFESVDCINLYFIYRWLLLMLKREFPHQEMLQLWDVLLVGYPTPHFHLFLTVSLLIQYRRPVMENKMEFDEVIKFFASLAGKFDLKESLSIAAALYENFVETTDADVREELLPSLADDKSLSASD